MNIVKFIYNVSEINKRLFQWNNYPTVNDEESYQICISINYQNKKYIVTPFSIFIPYSKCYLIIEDKEIELKIDHYNSIFRLIYFDCNIHCNQNDIIFSDIDNDNLKLNKLNKSVIKCINDDIINTTKHKIVFKNMVNDNLFPIIWIEATIKNVKEKEKILPGTQYVVANKIKGIVYNICDDIITIIPIINIITTINELKYLNLTYKTYNNYIVVKKKNNKIYKNDIITKLNGKKIINGTINLIRIGINIPIKSYFVYTNKNVIILNIYRPKKTSLTNLILSVNRKYLNELLSIDSSLDTDYTIKQKLILAKLNTFQIEWSIFTNIVFKCIDYYNYMNNPFKKLNKKNLLVGTTYSHPLFNNNEINEINFYKINFIKNNKIILDDNYGNKLLL